jgi:acyl-CoA reductase-like NAD-dependent aldehyde dehydrogenase
LSLKHHKYAKFLKELWKQIGTHIHNYKTYPRIVGETGGKDFIVAHQSANPKQVATGKPRGFIKLYDCRHS